MTDPIHTVSPRTDFPPNSFLQAPASTEALVLATWTNFSEYQERDVQEAGGEKAFIDGVRVFHTEGRDSFDGVIPCPALQSREHLDKVMDWFRNREDAVREVILVVTDTPQGVWNTVRDVEAVVLGRGWISTGTPQTMYMELSTLPADVPNKEITVQLLPGVPIFEDIPHNDPLPFYNTFEALIRAETGCTSDLWFRFVATSNETEDVLGLVLIHLTVNNPETGAGGVANVLNLGVVPSARRRGVATTLVTRALQHVYKLGCQYAIINSIAEDAQFFRRIGFHFLSCSYSWVIRKAALAGSVPEIQSRFIEAVANDNVKEMENIIIESKEILFVDAHGNQANLTVAPLPSGLTPIHIAITRKSLAAAEYLVRDCGVQLSIMAAWSLGGEWRGKAAEMIKANPESVNTVTELEPYSTAHFAIRENDTDLLKLVLDSGKADLQIKDLRHNATPRAWAEWSARTDCIKMLDAHEGK